MSIISTNLTSHKVYLRIILLLLIQLSNQSIVIGQNHVQLTVRDGLPSNLVYGAIKDSDGFVWFFTDNGVAKYDGYDFKIFNSDDGIQDSDIWHIHEDKYDRKWLINSSALGYYIENDSVKKCELLEYNFIKPQFLHFIDEGLVYNHIDSMFIFTNGQRSIYKSNDHQSREDKVKSLRKLNLSNETVEKIVDYNEDHANDLNINQFLSQICELRTKKSFCFNSNNLNFHLDRNGLVMHINKLGKEIKINLSLYGIEEVKAIKKNEDLLNINHTKGQMVFDLEKVKVISESPLSFIDHKLTRTLVDDRFLIAGSFYDGAIISNPFSLLNKYLSDKEISTIGFDGNNNIQFSTKNNELYNYNLLDNNEAELVMTNDELQKEKVVKSQKRTYLLYDQTILDLAYTNNIYKGNNDSLDNSNSYFSYFTLTNSNDIIFKDSLIYVLIYNYFFAIKEGIKNHLRYDNTNADLTCMEVFDDNFVIGSKRGFFTPIHTKFVRPTFIDSLPNTNITDLLNIDDEKLVVVSNYIKLHFWDKSEWNSIEDFSSPITDLSADGQYLYGLTADYLFRVNLVDDYKLQKFYFHSISGLSKIISLESTADTIFLGTENGYYKLHHNDLKTIIDTPKFISLKVHNNLGLIEEENLKDISSVQNNLQFSFKALSIISLGNIEYSYRLLPSESKWKTTKDLDVKYTSLSSNDYSFEIFATDAFGNKSEVQKIDFSIIPPWQESIGFYALTSLFLIGLVSIFYLIRLRRIQKDEEQKTLMNKKIAQFELQALRAQMNPHFIFNVLSSIQNAIRNQDVETADNHLFNFASLIRKFLEFSDKKFLTVQQEIDLIKLYSKIENLRFNPKMDIHFEVDEEIDTEHTYIPSMLLQPLVENAINHGLFYKKDDRKLSVIFKNNGDNLAITIEDNGIGREESHKKNRKRAANYTSKAFLNITSRIEILNQSDDVKIEYSIDDLKDTFSKAEGTRVNLLIINHDTNSYNNRR